MVESYWHSVKRTITIILIIVIIIIIIIVVLIIAYFSAYFQGVMNEYGKFLDFGNMAAGQFSTIAVLIGLGVVIGCVSVLTLGLSFCLSSNVIFMACGWLMSGDGT